MERKLIEKNDQLAAGTFKRFPVEVITVILHNKLCCDKRDLQNMLQ